MADPAVIEGEVESPAKASKSVAKRKIEAVPVAAPVADGDPMLAMIGQILRDPTVPMERVNQAFDFYKRVDEDGARKAFNAAFADAKGEFKPIVKKHQVEYGEGKNKTSYKHEDLGDIAEIVDPILAKHGLGFRYRGTSNLNEPISVTCIIFHRSGYSEETTLRAGADNSGGKNTIQSIGSAVTYLQRYTLRLALGLATKRDDDGMAAGAAPESITEKQVAELQSLVVDTNTSIARFCAYMAKLSKQKIERLEDIPAAKFQAAKDALDEKQRGQI